MKNQCDNHIRQRLRRRVQSTSRVAITCAAVLVAAGCFGDRIGEIPSDSDELIDAIFHAAKWEGPARTQALIDAGAATNRADLLGWTPLHYAVNRLHRDDFQGEQVIEAIASAPSTKVDATDNSGVTPALLAARYGSIEVLDILERHGADLETHDDDGLTLLMTAVAHRKTDMARHLLEKGFDVDERLEAGGTALFIAIRSRFPEMVSLLIEHGASVSGNELANDPIIFAAALGSVDVVKLLIDAGANVNAVNRKNGLTPLHRAVASGPAMVELLLESGARPDVSDQDGVTPLDAAREVGDTEAIRLLSEAG